MSNAEHGWKIKILSGLHVGAELVLPDEPTTLGSGDDCDLALDDATLAERHIELTPAANHLHLSLLDRSAPAYADGQAIEGAVDLVPFQIVTIGGIHLAFGPAREEWPHLDIPATQAATAAAEASGGEAAVEDAQAEEEDEQGDPPDQVSAPPAAAGRGSQRQALRRSALSAAGAAVLIVAAILWFGAPKEVERETLDADRLREVVNKLAGRLGAQVTVEISEDPAVPPTVTGFSRHERDQAQFEDGLREAGIRAATHLTSDSEILHAVLALTNQITTPDSDNVIEVAPSPELPGHMVIHGYVEDSATLSKLRQLVEGEVRRHRGFTYSVQTQADREAILGERLTGLQLVEALRIQRLDGAIALFGPAPGHEKLAELRELVQDFNQEFDSRPNLTLPATMSFLGKSTIELDYRALILDNDQNHLITHNGTAHTVGDRIMGEWTILAIDPRYVILEKASELAASENGGQQQSMAYFIVEEN